MRGSHRPVDVVVVGAGAAGLACAAALHAVGVDVVVVEARDRIGGRILTHRSADGSLCELGAQVVHGRTGATWDVLLRFGIRCTPMRGSEDLRVTGAGGRPLARTLPPHLITPWHLARALQETEPDASSRAALDQLRLGPAPQALAAEWLTQVCGAGLDEVSVASLVGRFSRERAASDQFVVARGYDAVPDALANGLEVVLTTPVRRVRWAPGQVIVVSDELVLNAGAVVLTVPPATVADGDLAFDPELPDKTAAADAIGNGDGIVVRIVVDRPWPRSEHVLSTDTELGLWRAVAGSAVLLGVATAGAASRVRSVVASEGVEALIAELFPTPKPVRATGATVADWGTDPWSRGAFSYLRPARLDAAAAWAAPVDSTLFFAGEATCPPPDAAMVHGALSSGRRAAQMVREARAV